MPARSKVIWALFAPSIAAVVFFGVRWRGGDPSGIVCSALLCGVLFLLSVGAVIDIFFAPKRHPPRGFEVMPPQKKE